MIKISTGKNRPACPAMKRCSPKRNLGGNFKRGELISRDYKAVSDANNMLLNYINIRADYNASM